MHTWESRIKFSIGSELLLIFITVKCYFAVHCNFPVVQSLKSGFERICGMIHENYAMDRSRVPGWLAIARWSAGLVVPEKADWDSISIRNFHWDCFQLFPLPLWIGMISRVCLFVYYSSTLCTVQEQYSNMSSVAKARPGQ